jgi:hypothetical protein
MNERQNENSSSRSAEDLIFGVMGRLERESDPVIARLRLEHRLSQQEPRPRVRLALKLVAGMAALSLMAGWAVNLPVAAWEDGQQISIQLPDGFSPTHYPHWVAMVSKHSQALADQGAHSLVVDYQRDGDGGFILQLGILGINYSQANEWTRDVIAQVPELQHKPYAITQPRVSYQTSVKEMLAFRLGDSGTEQRNVVRAWQATNGGLSRNGMVYLIAQPQDYAQRVSMVER